MKVELIGHYGSDLTHAQSAWVSTSRELTEDKLNRVDKLLEMLARDGHHCYDDITEILTQNGWKKFENLTDNDLVYSVDINTLNGQFEKPSQIYSSYYNEPMYYVTGQQVDLAVTKGHRMVVSQKRKSNGSDYGKVWEFQKSEDVYKKTRKYLKSSQINNNVDIYDSNFAKLLGFFIGDGFVSSKNSITFHIKLDRKIQYLYSLGFDVKILSNNKYSIYKDNIGNWFKENCYNNDKEKKLPNNFLSYSNSDVTNILDGLKNSDGSIKRKTWVYNTTSVELADQLKTLSALHMFLFTQYTTKSKNENWKDLIRLTYSNRITPEICNQKSRKCGTNDYWRLYTGKVYCVTVSTGAVLVRRNGHIIVSGNTPFEKSSLHFLVTTDVATHIQCLKHRISVSINTESARYKELKEDKFYIPEDWKGIKCTDRLIVEEFMTDDWAEIMKRHTMYSNELYHKSLVDVTPVLGRKRAKESARFFKTYNSELSYDVMFNFRSFNHFINLRIKDDAQLEIRQLSQDMVDLVKAIPGNPFKHTLKAFNI